MYNVCMIDIISKELPCKCLHVGNSWFLCFNIVVVGSMLNLISLWYPLMYRGLYDVWFLGLLELLEVIL